MRGSKTTEEEQELLKGLGKVKVMLGAQFIRPDRIMLAWKLRTESIQRGPQECYKALLTLFKTMKDLDPTQWKLLLDVKDLVFKHSL